jgi:tetratricopeptide (TPR) repeat protein
VGKNSSSSYLIDRQTDAQRLKRVAFDEFHKAHATGRLVAFLGSYPSEFFGYGTWDDLVDDFFGLQKAMENKDDLIKQLRRMKAPKDRFLDTLIRMDLAELAAGTDRHATPGRFKEQREQFAESFLLQGRQQEAAVRPNVIASLFDHLHIRRFMTLNYDLEIEWTLLTTDAEKKAAASWPSRRAYFEDLLGTENLLRRSPAGTTCPDARLERYLTGRGKIISDVLDRDRSEVLTEFALETPWRDTRILHLHGRADLPESLVVTKRDYRDRYWEAGFSKLPFEYGMRLIFSGNPVLFVGIGSSEPDVMRTLEQFLSDNPNRRAVPAFLLWESPDPSEETLAAVQRLELYRRYGIHLLFDRDIAEIARVGNYQPRIEAPLPAVDLGKKEKRILGDLNPKESVSARRLEEPVRILGRLAQSAGPYKLWPEKELRTPQSKLDSQTKPDGEANFVKMWFQVDGLESEFKNAHEAAERLSDGRPIKAIIAEPGSGRGALAKAIATALSGRDQRLPFIHPDRVVLINGSFTFETDSIFGILSGASDGTTAQKEGISRVQALRNTLSLIDQLDPAELVHALTVGSAAASADDAKFTKHRRVTIIVNGMERFIGHDGSALSNELDILIRILINFYGREEFREKWEKLSDALSVDFAEDRLDPPINLILIGTGRIRRYLSAISSDIDYLTIRDAPEELRPGKVLVSDPDAQDVAWRPIWFSECWSYFKAMRQAFDDKRVTGESPLSLPLPSLKLPARDVDRPAARRSFLGQALKEETLEGRARDPLLCLEIVRTLAFVGQPVERGVLNHVPRIGDLSGETPAKVDDALEDLKALKLILPIEPFIKQGHPRFGLHKAVMAEVRDRYGVPLSDAQLSGGFNLSLTAAQTVGSAAPELAWHDDLGQLVDFLAGAFTHPMHSPLGAKAAKILGKEELRQRLSPDLLWYPLEQRAAMASEEFSACLRAALAIMRSYYSVAALLMQANRDLDPWMRDGPLSEHADRLARLLRMGRNAAELRALIREEIGTDPALEAETGDAAKILGPNAFYPDDLVWLNNELGVVRATQGSLYEAEQAFHQAQVVNDRWVECGDRQQNWRRIQLNLAQAGVDRGDIEGVEERLRDLEDTIEAQARAVSTKPNACDYIIRTYAREPHSRAEGPRRLPFRTDRRYPTDLILAVALIQGFRGQCMHLRGALDGAKACYSNALSILLRLDEMRAYAYFQRQAAALHAALGDREAARQGLKLCIAAAGPSRQTDIDHSGRVALVQYDLVETVTARPPWIMQLTESLRYATAGDMFRLQLECMQALAQVHLRHGDTDSALRYANDALAIAARCGFDLRSVSLRILVARILAFRGDRASARALLETAEHIATKMKYERAVEAAENELIRLG